MKYDKDSVVARVEERLKEIRKEEEAKFQEAQKRHRESIETREKAQSEVRE